MALTNFGNAIQSSGSGFDRKLNQLMGIGQAIKGSQVAKQRMQDELRQQKELIEYRADTQLERQVEYYDRVTQPANEAEAKAKAQREQQKAILDSQQAADEKYKEIIDTHNSEYNELQKWGLYKPIFQKYTDPETGFSDVRILEKQGEDFVPIDYQQYRAKAEGLKQEAEWFETLEEGIEKNWFPESYPEGEETRTRAGQQIERLTRSKANDIIQSARRNPEMAYQFLQDSMQRFEVPAPFEAPDTEGSGSSSRKDTRGATSFIASVNEFADENGVVEFEYVTEGGWFSDPERKTSSVNFNGLQTVGQIEETLQQTANDVFEIDLESISKFDDDTRTQILAGNSDGLKGDEKDLAKRINRLREEGADTELDKLFNTYYGLPSAIRVWRERFGNTKIATLPDSKLIPNFTNPSSEADFFTTPDMDVTATAFGLRQQLSTQ